MKKIKINAYLSPDKTSVRTKQRLHNIVLGNSVTICFTNKRNLTKFLYETNLFLDIKVLR